MDDTIVVSLNDPVYYYKAGEFVAGAGWVHKTMQHDDDFEIILGVKGLVSLWVNADPLDIRPGECVVIRPGATIAGRDPSRQPVDFYWLHFFATWKQGVISKTSSVGFRPEMAADLDRIRHREFCPDLNGVSILPDMFRLEHPSRAYLLFGQLLDIANSYRYSQRENDFMTGAMLVELSHQYLRGVAQENREESAVTARIAEWIRSHMSADLTVAFIANHFHMNPDYVSRLFREELGVNLRSYLLGMRLEAAKVLLVQSDLTIEQVARNAFFNDVRNFMKLFKRKTGVTPTQYRQNFSHTHLNNPHIDPSIPVPQEVEVLLEHGGAPGSSSGPLR